MHVHVTDTTYKLLERKSYEVQERPKMTINGNLSITTYFVLNKKDRSGKVITRPFQIILEEMKRQDTEKAKMKQSSSLKGATIPTPTCTTPTVTINENNSYLVPPTLIVPVAPPPSVYEPLPPSPPAHVPMEIPVTVKPVTSMEDEEVLRMNGDVGTKIRSSNDQSLKTFEVITDRPTIFTRQSRSKTCALL